jgi:hypothetical protein
MMNFDPSWEDNELISVVEDTFNRVGWENFFHYLPREQLTLMVCMYLGMQPAEIIEVMHFKDIRGYYNANVKLKSIYRKEKNHFIDYN